MMRSHRDAAQHARSGPGRAAVSDTAVLDGLLEHASRSLKDALVLSDEHGLVLAVNTAYQTLYGFAEQELVGRSFAVIFPEEQRDTTQAAYRQVFQNRAPAVHQSTIRRGDGVERQVESRITFVKRSRDRTAMLSAIHATSALPAAAVAEHPIPTTLDLTSLALLYDTHVRSALGYVHTLLRDVVQTEQVVEDALLATWRVGIAHEQDDAAARLLLFSVLRQRAGQVLLARARTRPGPHHGWANLD